MDIDKLIKGDLDEINKAWASIPPDKLRMPKVSPKFSDLNVVRRLLPYASPEALSSYLVYIMEYYGYEIHGK